MTSKQLKQAYDNFHLVLPPPEKANNESKPLEQNDNDGSKRLTIGTKLYKVFNATKHTGKTVKYDRDAGYCSILHEDGDSEEMSHNQAKQHLHSNAKATNKYKPSSIAAVTAKMASTEHDEDEHTISFNAASLRAIASINCGEESAPEKVSDEEIRLSIQTLGSSHITPEEEALGYFTRKKLQRLPNWKDWEKGEFKQLNQFHQQGMFGDPINAHSIDPNAVILRAHWQHNVKQDGTRRSRLCCNGSKKAAPKLHAMAQTWSSCVELPVQ